MKPESRAPNWRGHQWLSEVVRTFVALSLGVVATLVLSLLGEPHLSYFPSTMDQMVAYMALYLVTYLVLTGVVFSRAPESAVVRWSRRVGKGTWMQRYIWGTAPGPGVTIWVSLTALVVAVVWLPYTSSDTASLGLWVRVALGLVVVTAGWATVVISFAVAYRADDLLEDQTGLAFPDTPNPGWSDYVYFAVAVSTTFGTTDVNVRTASLRRTVTVHALVAFVFNTVILAGVIGFLISI